MTIVNIDKKTPKIILFNGPPHCGKDTIASEIQANHLYSEVVKFATPLKTVAKHLYCHGCDELFTEMDKPQNKGQPHDLFFGKSCREVQIAISETYAKPLHGQNVFGKILASHIHNRMKQDDAPNIFLVSDSGFRPEAEELVKQFGAENMILFRLHREGTSFKGDSRNYIELFDLGVPSFDVDNDGSIEDTVDEVTAIIERVFNI